MQCAEPDDGHDVPGFTDFPMSQNSHVVMSATYGEAARSDSIRYRMLTHYADIPVVRAL
jgi:hypothetical protein